MTDTGTNDLSLLEARVAAVEKVQAVNVPKFLAVCKRVAKLEKAMTASVTQTAEIKALIAKDSAVRNANAEKLDTIVSMMTTAKGAWGFVRKYGPHAASLLIGALVASGYVSAETGKSFSHLFGF